MLIALIVWHKGRGGNRDRKGRGGKVWRQIVQYRGGTLGKQWNLSPFLLDLASMVTHVRRINSIITLSQKKLSLLDSSYENY